MVYFYRRPKNFFRIPKIVFEMVSILVGKGKSEAALRYFLVGVVCRETEKGWLKYCFKNRIIFLKEDFSNDYRFKKDSGGSADGRGLLGSGIFCWAGNG